MTALRFVLSIARDEGAAVRIAATGPAGTVGVATLLPVQESGSNQDGGAPARDWDEARRIGADLFAFAFPPAVDELLEESRHRASDSPVTVVVEIGDDDLAALPWELLFDPEIERFLALSLGTPFTRSSEDVPEASPPEHGNLRVRMLAPAIDESVLAASQAVAPDPRVDVAAGTPKAKPGRRAHVVILSEGLDPETSIPPRTPLAVITGDLTAGRRALSPARAVLVLPPGLDVGHRTTLLRALLSRLAMGDTTEAATVAARRAVAADQNAPPAAWAGPVLLTRTLPAPIVEPQQISTILGRRVMEQTVSWVQDALAGVVSSIVVFIVGLILFRLGFSSSNSFELDILSPVSLYQSFSALIIELSNYRQSFLLVASGLLAATTGIVALLWWRNRVVDPEEATGLAARFAGPLSRLRTLTFLAVATWTVFGSYGYQQYLWRAKLPIPNGALGIAVTRDAQTGAFQERLATTLADPTNERAVVVRELPVQYDAANIDTARQVGKRIGAEAVIVYRSEESAGATSYVAYLVFTDPHLGRTFVSRAPTVLTGSTPAQSPATTRIQEGIAVPILRASSLDALAEAGAGILDYEAGRIGQALDHLERARQLGIEETDAGLLDFYLASAYALDDQPAAAQSTYAAAAGAYEERATSERLGPQDELVLVTTYLALGNLAREAGEWQTAIQWLQKGIAHRDELLARASGLDRPSDVNEVYARIYGQLATAYRATGDREEEIFWAKRANDEVQTLAGRVGSDDRAGLVRLSATRLAVGDCVGAVDAVNRALAIAPGDPDALLNAAAIALLQSDAEAARTHLSGVAPGNPVAVRAHDELGLLSTLAAVNSTDGFLEPAFLAEARTVLEAVASPSGLALQELGVAAAWEGDATMMDLTSLYGGDDLAAAKSRIEWSADPVRRQVAIDAYTRAIARLTELATRRPNDPAVAAALAGAYAGRMSAYAAGSISGTGGTDQDVPLLLADAAAVRAWADKVLAANSGATRRDRLAAWSLTLEAMNDSRLAGASRGELVDALRQVVEQAKSEAQIAPPTDDLEAAAIRAIFDEIIHYATTVAPDPVQAADAVTARAAVAGPSPVDQALLRTVCREERERLGGDTLLAAGNPVSAQARYEAALQANPRFAPALIGFSAARERQGDPAGAVAQAAAASDAAPNLPAAWQSLGIAQLTAGNAADRDAAFDRFFALVAEEPSQMRTAHLRLAIASVRDVVDRHADLAPAVRELIPRFQVALDASPQETGEYQRAARYAELGSLALAADDATIAESLLRRSLELDQHQPLVLTDLALAVLVQGRDATTEIQAALDETEEPLWEAAGIAQADLLKRMADRIAEYKRRSPERAPMLEPLADAIAQAEAAATPPEGGTPIAEASPPTRAASPEVESPLIATPSAQATYESPTFGFTLTVKDGWTILQTIQEESIEGVQLSNGISFISVFIFQAPDTTPAQCLQQRHSDLAAEEGVSDVALLTGSDGKAIRGSSDEHAFAAFRFTYGIEDGMPPDRVKYISCRGYPDLGAILLVEQVAPAESYEEQAAAREELLATLVLPEP